MEFSIALEESGSILSIPRRHFSRRGSWIATVTSQSRGPAPSRREEPRMVALSLATRIDPTFSVDRIFFSPEPLLAALEQSRPREVYYFEGAALNGAGLPQLAGEPFLDLIIAAQRHGVGLILTSKVPDNYLTYLIRNARNSAIILQDTARGGAPQGDALEASKDTLVFAWYECQADVLYGRRRAVMKVPIINGQRVTGVLIPPPPEDLLQVCRGRAEEHLAARYHEALKGGL